MPNVDITTISDKDFLRIFLKALHLSKDEPFSSLFVYIHYQSKMGWKPFIRDRAFDRKEPVDPENLNGYKTAYNNLPKLERMINHIFCTSPEEVDKLLARKFARMNYGMENEGTVENEETAITKCKNKMQEVKDKFLKLIGEYFKNGELVGYENFNARILTDTLILLKDVSLSGKNYMIVYDNSAWSEAKNDTILNIIAQAKENLQTEIEANSNKL